MAEFMCMIVLLCLTNGVVMRVLSCAYGTQAASYLRHVHEAGPCCGNQPQGLDGAVHQLGENVTGCLCRFCAAVHLIYQQ